MQAYTGPGVTEAEELRWGWMAQGAASALWDDDTWRAMLGRQVRLARAAGELDQLPVTLGALGTAVAWSGDFAAADALVAEAEAVCAATGSRAAPFTAMMLAALRGSEADALPLVGATLADAVAAGQGIAVTYAQWTSAVLFNGLSRYEEALTAARQASDDTPGNYVAMWALPELAEAAARSGQPDEAAGAVARLAELTGAGRTDFGLGVEARCRALVSPPAGGRAVLPGSHRPARAHPAPARAGPGSPALRGVAPPREPARGRPHAATDRARPAVRYRCRGLRRAGPA